MSEVFRAREVHLVRRPSGLPEDDDFALVERELPPLADGEALVANRLFSVDPYMRGRMDDSDSYAPPYPLDAALTGRAVGEVVASASDNLAVGDLVLSNLGWSTHGIATARELQRLPAVEGVPASAYLGVLGATGLTAWVGLLEVARMRAGDTVYVSGAAGAVGSVVGQLARLKGAARVVGSAGSPAKVAWLVDELGFDAAFDHRAGPVVDQLREAAPDGIDVYFDNVGGDHLDAAFAVANDFARFAECGMIAGYNDADAQSVRNVGAIVRKRLSVQGFIITDALDRFPAFLAEATPLVAEGRLRFAETVVDGIENAVDAFRGLFRGDNRGKMVVRVS